MYGECIKEVHCKCKQVLGTLFARRTRTDLQEKEGEGGGRRRTSRGKGEGGKKRKEAVEGELNDRRKKYRLRERGIKGN